MVESNRHRILESLRFCEDLELSYGRGMGDYYLYGVTFADFKNMDYKDFSACCHTFAEVESKLESMFKTDQIEVKS